jgi:hypothetical protein
MVGIGCSICYASHYSGIIGIIVIRSSCEVSAVHAGWFLSCLREATTSMTHPIMKMIIAIGQNSSLIKRLRKWFFTSAPLFEFDFQMMLYAVKALMKFI